MDEKCRCGGNIIVVRRGMIDVHTCRARALSTKAAQEVSFRGRANVVAILQWLKREYPVHSEFIQHKIQEVNRKWRSVRY